MAEGLAWGAAHRVLAADLGCSEEDLAAEGVRVVEWRKLPGRRRYPVSGPAFHMVTVGRGVVVSCDGPRLAWARAALGRLTRDEAFAAQALSAVAQRLAADGQRLSGPTVAWVRAPESVRRPAPPVAVRVLAGEAVRTLYDLTGFPHALGYGRSPERPDVLACVALDARGAVVGVAGASADSDSLWQVGVDVLPECRGRGIGTAVVSAATEAVLARGRLPFYVAAPSNLASVRVAVAAGYRPCWTQVYAQRA